MDAPSVTWTQVHVHFLQWVVCTHLEESTMWFVVSIWFANIILYLCTQKTNQNIKELFNICSF